MFRRMICLYLRYDGNQVIPFVNILSELLNRSLQIQNMICDHDNRPTAFLLNSGHHVPISNGERVVKKLIYQKYFLQNA